MVKIMEYIDWDDRAVDIKYREQRFLDWHIKKGASKTVAQQRTKSKFKNEHLLVQSIKNRRVIKRIKKPSEKHLKMLGTVFKTAKNYDYSDMIEMPKKGVYFLLFSNQVVYIGQSNANTGIKSRIESHSRNHKFFDKIKIIESVKSDDLTYMEDMYSILFNPIYDGLLSGKVPKRRIELLEEVRKIHNVKNLKTRYKSFILLLKKQQELFDSSYGKGSWRGLTTMKYRRMPKEKHLNTSIYWDF